MLKLPLKLHLLHQLLHMPHMLAQLLNLSRHIILHHLPIAMQKVLLCKHLHIMFIRILPWFQPSVSFVYQQLPQLSKLLCVYDV